MKNMLIFAVIIVLAAGYLIGDSIKVSKHIETWSLDNLKEPDLEKSSYFNIKYMNLIGNFDRTLELIEKYKARYTDKSANIPELVYMTALIYEKKIEPAKVRDILKMYIETYPEQKNIEEAKTKLREYKTPF
jgi:hypothetical protein